MNPITGQPTYPFAGGPGLRLNIKQSDERGNRQNIVRTTWGDASIAPPGVQPAHHFHSDHLLAWSQDRYFELNKTEWLGGDLSWGSTFAKAMEVEVRRKHIFHLLFGEQVDYVEVVEFTNKASWLPVWYFMAWKKKD